MTAPIPVSRAELPPIVDAAWVAAELRLDPTGSGTPPLVVVDVRWYLDGRSGSDAFDAGHLPGAVWIDLERWLAAAASPARGRHPLPDPETFAEGMALHGIGDDTAVIAYDDLGGMVAGRLVWMLRSLGANAGLLDGGLTAWSGEVETGPGRRPAPASFTARPWPADRLVTTDDVATRPAGVVVVDARAAERYRGEVEPIDPRAGHIPGARNLPLGGNLGPDGRFLDPETLRARFAGVGIDDDTTAANAVMYCGSGVSACHNLLALEAAGLGRARLYVGSWSAWSSDPARPAATTAD